MEEESREVEVRPSTRVWWRLVEDGAVRTSSQPGGGLGVLLENTDCWLDDTHP